eukprot:47306-Rhodomonas_salina.2
MIDWMWTERSVNSKYLPLSTAANSGALLQSLTSPRVLSRLRSLRDLLHTLARLVRASQVSSQVQPVPRW